MFGAFFFLGKRVGPHFPYFSLAQSIFISAIALGFVSIALLAWSHTVKI